MSNQIYNWQRFWCSPSDRFYLDYYGYLSDPKVQSVNGYNYNPNPNLVTFREISGIPCLILLGEPGIGKTQAMEEEEDKITAELNNTDDEILSLDLRSVLTKDELTQKLFKSEEFTRWQSGRHRLHIFLDSFDECLLEINKLAVILVDAIKNYKEHVKLKRLTLRIACRTAVLPSVLEPGLKKLFGEDSLKIYQLVPLRRQDVVKAAEANGIDPDTFLEEVSRKNIVPLAIKPITLNFIINSYCRGSGEFIENKKRIDKLYLYLKGCRCLCEENNPSRRDSGAIGDLDPDQRLIIAARIAAVTIFANRFGVWTGTDTDYPRSKDQLILIDDDLCMREEVAKSKNFEITEPGIKEVLDTGLFSAGGEKRIGWSHQTYAEFLAAWYLKEHNVSVSFFQSLFYLSKDEDPEHKLIPQFHETAAWLATMIPEIREVILSSDPDVLLLSDIPKDASVREALVFYLLMQSEQEIFVAQNINYRLDDKLKHPTLAEQLRPYIVDASKSSDARDTAIKIAEVCELKELQNELVTLATDSAETIELRISAVQAIGEIGDKNSILKLKPLALNPLPEDQDDSLKGCCLQALYNDQFNDLTDDELLDALTPPKKINLILGSYQMFIKNILVPMLQEKWRREPRLKSDFIKEEGKSGKFVNVLVNLGEIDYDCRLDDFVLDLIGDIYLTPRIGSKSDKSHKNFAISIYRELQLNNKEEIDWIIEDYYLNNKGRECCENFSYFFRGGKLPSNKARNPRPKQKLLEPSLRERVIIRLSQLEDGNLSAWWWLNIEMALKPDSRHYNHEFEPDLTKLPGWKEADELTRTRIIQGAENYIINQKDINTDWIGKNEVDRPALAGCRAFLLLLNKAPKIIETIPSEKWGIWAPVIIAFPLGSENYDSCLELVKRVYSKARDQVIETLNILIDQENDQYHYIARIRIFKKCWDKHLSDFILEKAKKPSIKPKCMGHLLEYILKHGSDEAKDEVIEYLQTLSRFSSLPPLKKDEREKVIIALTFLLYYPTADRWSSIWSILEQEPKLKQEFIESVANRNNLFFGLLELKLKQERKLGREFIESVANRNNLFIGLLELKLKVNEKQFADLYIWLVSQYPYHEDPDHSNGVPYDVSPRDRVARLRDDILQHLASLGTPDACYQLDSIIQKFPELPWLKKTLISAKDTMRRKSWNGLQPEKVIKKILDHDPRVNQTVGDNQATYNIEIGDNQGGIVNIGGKNTNNMAKNSKINTDGGDFLNNSYNKNKGSVKNSKTITTNKIGKGKRNTIKVTDPKTNPNRISIIAIVTLVLTGLGLIGNGIFNEQIKRFFRIDQQPSLSPTPTVPSPSSTPDSE
ncbi:MAG: hypothetical protein F6J90_08500 [Moorea sp. SIOASIH]|uniref:NACHT domain-containing protein n=1 Tax=Moorena sp. SIOASIH TaxID=2607817 RepID=UPI0013BE7049|nr:hypothetical protein [Moorena sp. SIOASIH]NEO36356.1 hypothetical protein [Moorena sp. SIOASIH]